MVILFGFSFVAAETDETAEIYNGQESDDKFVHKAKILILSYFLIGCWDLFNLVKVWNLDRVDGNFIFLKESVFPGSFWK